MKSIFEFESIAPRGGCIGLLSCRREAANTLLFPGIAGGIYKVT